jgi:hypothetical protein
MTLAIGAMLRPIAAPAQEPPKDAIKVQMAVSGVADFFLVPTQPPVGSGRLNFKGTSEAFGGDITMIDMHTGHLGVDGVFLRSTDGHAVFRNAAGDELYLNWSGTARPTDTPNLYAFSGSFTVTGGKGKFAGATGSGVMNSRVNLGNLEVAQVWEGLVLLPKKP